MVSMLTRGRGFGRRKEERNVLVILGAGDMDGGVQIDPARPRDTDAVAARCEAHHR